VGTERELVPASEYGVFGGKYNWQVTIEPFTFSMNEPEQYPVTAYRVGVEVNWVELGHTRQIELSSIKLKKNDATSLRSGLSR
jgi:hypothetical protein